MIGSTDLFLSEVERILSDVTLGISSTIACGQVSKQWELSGAEWDSPKSPGDVGFQPLRCP